MKTLCRPSVYFVLIAGVLSIASADDGPLPPRSGATGEQNGLRVSAASEPAHWAFRPVRKPVLPIAETAQSAAAPLDRFVLAVLEERALKPSPLADRRTLIRRATFDLIGLPPTSEAVEEFREDSSPDAFARLVDRLLASPLYGERWGRHWLDVARYADTKGKVFDQEARFAFSYTYRDYVIRVWNEDLPYDRFVLEQLAADRLTTGDNQSALAALGFLTLGRRFNNKHDIIDDRIDVTTRGLMGLTVLCSRCHDHPYDPIPTEDYYSLYGVFASSVEPVKPPLIATAAPSEAYRAYQKELAKREGAFDREAAKLYATLLDRLRTRIADYLVAAVRTPSELFAKREALFFPNEGDLILEVVRRWQVYLAQTAKQHHPVFAPWHALAGELREDRHERRRVVNDGRPPQKDDRAKGDRAARTVARLAEAGLRDPSRRVNTLVSQALIAGKPTSMLDVARIYGRLLRDAHAKVGRNDSADAPQNGVLFAPSKVPSGSRDRHVSRPPDPDEHELREVLYGVGTPTAVTREDVWVFYYPPERVRLTKLRRKLEELWCTSAAPPAAMVLVDAPTPYQPRVFIRGNPSRLGNKVPRRFLTVLSDTPREPFETGSGRLDLAHAIASKSNPLTARVLVNRVWMHHFGRPLVDTPSDFGTQNDPPLHQKLLDYLAWTFMEDGWSIKRLHRRILLSATYQQASHDRPACRRVDPENRLLWRMNRRRLEFEAFRDSLLAVAGRLEARLGGRPVDLFKPPYSTRRTVYGFVDREDIPAVMRMFDVADPNASCPQRHHTTVPQQALFGMNSPFVIEQAQYLARQTVATGRPDAKDRILALYRLVFARMPDPEEVEIGLKFMANSPTLRKPAQNDSKPKTHANAQTNLTAWEKYAQMLLLTNEFSFID